MFDFEYFLSCFYKLLPALPATLFITFFSFVVGGFLGLIFALIRLYKVPILWQFVLIWVSFFRGVPLLVHLFLFYYGIPIFLRSLEVDINFLHFEALYYALIAFSFYASAYLCEIFRAALNGVDKGQSEAAYSVGMNKFQALKRIILPQALMLTLPNLLNFFILQVKNTALASIITVPELMGLADIESGRSSKFLEVYLMAALLYWILCVLLEFIFSYFERYFKKFDKNFI